MSILLDILLGAGLGVALTISFYIVYRFYDEKSAKYKRKETVKELQNNISKLKMQRSFLAKKCQLLSTENDSLKSKLWIASSELSNKDLELMEAKEENKLLLDRARELMSKVENILLKNSKYKQ